MLCIFWKDPRGLHGMSVPEKMGELLDDATRLEIKCLCFEIQMFQKLSEREVNYTWYFRMFDDNLCHLHG
jgi:hypothetical protein